MACPGRRSTHPGCSQARAEALLDPWENKLTPMDEAMEGGWTFPEQMDGWLDGWLAGWMVIDDNGNAKEGS